ncbi:MAG TPA: ComEC/Rec2 family competence protein, partial [Coxiellaceae bacterium]|nr:ComEC/Rec2 family competence protein [Coxiellaceae bacterium]
METKNFNALSLTQSKIFLVFCLSLILGIALGRIINFEIMAVLAMIFIIIATVFWNKIVLVCCLSGLIMLAGTVRFKTYEAVNYLTDYYGQKLALSGTVSEEPDVRTDKTLLTVSSLKIDNQQIPGKVLLTASKFPEYKYGDVLNINGKIQEPQDADEPGEFSYKNYLSRFGITGLIYYPDLSLAGSGEGNIIKAALINFKTYFISQVSSLLPEPQNAFLSGILVGLRRSIPQDLLDNFNATGTTHIIALSGFNITIIADAFAKLLERFGRRTSFVLSLVGIALFVVMSGASASVVRAGVMGGLALVALNIGRLYAITNALAFTA